MPEVNDAVVLRKVHVPDTRPGQALSGEILLSCDA